jgi:two-component system, cell cycle response regulator DivK
VVERAVGKTILIVEDDKDSRSMYADVLERHGYRVLQAATGADGIRMAREVTPDLVLMNLMLPLVNGSDATEVLKNAEATSNIPIVIITGHGSPAIQDMAWEAGCDDYLLKPVSPKRLLREVRSRIGPATKGGGKP